MTNLDRAKAMNDALPKLQGLQQEQHRLKKYITREEQLRTSTELLAGLAAITSELRAREMAPTGFLDTCRGHQLEVQRVAGEFKTDPASIDAQPVETFWQPLKHIPEKVRKGVLKAWEGYVEQNTPPIQSGILSIFANVPGLAKQAAKVCKLLAELKRLGEKLPDQGDFEKMESLAVQITEIWGDLDGDGLPKAVLDFLRGAHAPSGAQLATLNKEVSDWLERMNLLTNYVVKAR